MSAQINYFLGQCRDGNDLTVKRLVTEDQGLVNRQNHHGVTGLMIAMRKCQNEVVKSILTSSLVDVNVSNKDGRTALHYGTFNTEGIKLILEHPKCTKEFVRKKNDKGFTAYEGPFCYGPTVEVLKEYLKSNDGNNEDVGIESISQLAKNIMVEPKKLTMEEIRSEVLKLMQCTSSFELVKEKVAQRQKDELDKLLSEPYSFSESEAKVEDLLERHSKESEDLLKDLGIIIKRKEDLENELKARVTSLFPEEPIKASIIPECPYCFEEFRPPLKIYNCRNGHLVCSDCRPKLDRDDCHCGSVFLGRATAMEQLVVKLVNLNLRLS